MKTVKLEKLKAIDGRNIQDPQGNEITIKEFVNLFLFQIPFQALKLEDSVKAQNYFGQVSNQNGTKKLSIEDAEYAWVEDMIAKYAHLIAGLNAIKIKEAWANIEKE